MKPEQSLELALEMAKKHGAESCDVWVGETTSEGLELFEQKTKNLELSTSRGLGVRLFVNGCPGYAFTEKFSTEAIEQTVRDAVAHTSLTGTLKVELPDQLVIPQIDLKHYTPALDSVDIATMRQLGLEMEAIAKAAHSTIENIPFIGLGKNRSRSWMGNHKGIRAVQMHNDVYAGIGVVAHQNGVRKMGVYSNQILNMDDFSSSQYAHRAVTRAVELLDPKPIASGKYPIVLSHRVSPSFFSMYSSAFFAEVAQKKQSRLVDKIGEQIASSMLSIYCEPHIIGAPGSRLFDGEGVLTKSTTVVEQGVFTGFLYNLESATKEGKASSGHAARGYSGQVGTSFSNYIVPCGSSSLSQLLSTYPKCLYIVALEGGSGCSSVSGEVSIGVQGFLVEYGKVVHPVDSLTISGNYYELLKKIEGLGNEYSDRVSSVKVPDVLLGSMDVAC